MCREVPAGFPGNKNLWQSSAIQLPAIPAGHPVVVAIAAVISVHIHHFPSLPVPELLFVTA